MDDRKLEVIKVTPQRTITSLHREVVLDVLCKLGSGENVNIEVQKGNNNDDIRRTRFHLSSITSNITPKGTEFRDVPNVTIIYISEYDVLNNNQAVTMCEMCELVGKKYVPIGDGARIYYANTVVHDNTDKSELLALLLKDSAFESDKFPRLSNAVRYFKEDKKGVQNMCTIVEEYANKVKLEGKLEGKLEEKLELVERLIESDLGLSDEKISELTSLSIEEVSAIRNRE